jgi:hypothetical protein
MSTDRQKGLRIQVMVILVLLILQFELGMAANLNGPPELAPFSYSNAKFSDALTRLVSWKTSMPVWVPCFPSVPWSS